MGFLDKFLTKPPPPEDENISNVLMKNVEKVCKAIDEILAYPKYSNSKECLDDLFLARERLLKSFTPLKRDTIKTLWEVNPEQVDSATDQILKNIKTLYIINDSYGQGLLKKLDDHLSQTVMLLLQLRMNP